jgi:hypothetical protein
MSFFASVLTNRRSHVTTEFQLVLIAKYINWSIDCFLVVFGDGNLRHREEIGQFLISSSTVINRILRYILDESHCMLRLNCAKCISYEI